MKLGLSRIAALTVNHGCERETAVAACGGTLTAAAVGLFGSPKGLERPCWAFVAVLTCLGICPPSTAGSDLRYRIVPLEPLPGGFYSWAYGINDMGQVVGYSVHNRTTGGIGNSRPVRWDGGGPAELLWRGRVFECVYDFISMEFVCEPPLLAGGEPRAINNAGVVVGQAGSFEDVELPTPGIEPGVAFIWDEVQGMRTLGTFGGSSSEALSINDGGQVAGSADRRVTIEIDGVPHVFNSPMAFIWDEERGMRELGTLFGGNFSRGTGINRFGQVTGYSGTSASGEVGFIWSEDTGMVPLATLGDGAQRPQAINDMGHVVGGANGQAVLWQDGTVIGLGFLPGDGASGARDINNVGQVIGKSNPAGGFGHIFLWDKDHGMRDLGELIIGAGGWRFSDVYSISDNGQIVGIGRHNDVLKGFLLVPTPEPSSLCLAAFGMSFLIGSRLMLCRVEVSRDRFGSSFARKELRNVTGTPADDWNARSSSAKEVNVWADTLNQSAAHGAA